MPRFASVVVDIRTRAIARAFDYGVPPALEREVRVGCCVAVDFHGRPAVGYVVGLSEEPPAGVDPARIRPVRQALSEPLFSEVAAACALWIAREYAALPSEAVRLFCPPGFVAEMRRDPATGAWALRQAEVAPADDRWVCLTPEGRTFTPRANAARQRAVVEALAAGPVRAAELAATLPGASAAVSALAKRGVVAVEHRQRVRGCPGATALSSASAPVRAPEELTRGQRNALAAIERARRAGRGDVVLLDGVTGSGKTEVYLEAIERTLADGRDAVVLVPEISLTPQTVGRFRSRFGERVAVLHSRLSAGERRDQWELAATGCAKVVVGARSALFAPLADPGLYVIDEEHESSYKQSSAPRYHAREVAAHLARAHGAALVLGSATPSLEALERCREGAYAGAAWTRVEMPERPCARPLPPVEVVDMAAEFASGWRSMFSRPLTRALKEVVGRGEKAVLMLNQRGFARWMLCRDCGYVPRCEHCSTSLTFHARGAGGPHLTCHTCGVSYPVPARCPKCGSRFFRFTGMGTQQVEDKLRAQLEEITEGGAPVVRMDADTTRAKGGHERCLEEFDATPGAILVGTQMIAKGLDFPDVTLVGVVNADTVLKVCDFRAAERTYDLLEQVAGRAGRGDVPGRVVIQTYQPAHPAILAAAAHDRAPFLDFELPLRREVGYPPFTRLANVLVWGRFERDVCAVAREAAARVREALADVPGSEVLGPVECVISRAQDQVRHHVLVRARPEAPLGELLGDALAPLEAPRGVRVAVDVDPYDLL